MLREAVKALLVALCDLFRSRSALLAENTLLRQQVILLHRATPHPRLKARDRFIIGAITKLFPSLVAAVPIVRHDTVIRWHHSLWSLIWRRRSRRPVGRPPIDADTRALIRRMWIENPLWGEDVIAAELAKLGHHVSPRTVAKYRPARLPRGRGQKWSTFIRNHLGQTWAADWFTIVTVRFEILYAFVILDLEHGRACVAPATLQAGCADLRWGDAGHANPCQLQLLRPLTESQPLHTPHGIIAAYTCRGGADARDEARALPWAGASQSESSYRPPPT
ncbi:MAG TPA: hypothetical protein VJ860_05770 [Polyangia bacterium]|nr:hypothetical protein [Polyangia bacterium]